MVVSRTSRDGRYDTLYLRNYARLHVRDVLARIRGAGDARATGIYAAAYSQDAEFYSFVRSLNAYQTTFSNKSDMMLVDPKSDFFRYLKNPNGSFQE